VNYNFGMVASVTELIMTADWEAKAGQRWTVPLGGGMGKLFRLASCHDSTLEAFWNVVHPDYAGIGNSGSESRSYSRLKR